ncbi:DUF11 domain-containing protein [Nocardia seriolae]|uniref:DUF11 domain-containing protein n=2 Tax=Nocardia seriolae TaxID=37332 RepID=A0A0B8NBL5_9NOCA|nr:DUF11 domain-containing protein [Nocardia seriolae]APA98527.1 hypothetical protein NS506_04479 [Nocardia seriolae]MTJ63621.1 DUF11 domain-containing protein [Nocardia seriolae]MTK41521.1 DUF11 domain-containing protein [Nocardia seriolae]QOW35511.1 DUF11 domain-containing protein [Nocardia seriolae]QUN17007.1 DUF11 domain-containing protein [Nocardia seriolae]
MINSPKPALKRAVMVGSAFALVVGAVQFAAAPAYAVTGPTTKYECRDVQTPGKLFPGDEVACTLTVSTTGSDTFTNIVAEVTIPDSTVYESGGTRQGTQKVAFTLGEVTKAKSASATMTVMVAGQTPDKTAISSQAVVKGFAPNGSFDTNAQSNTLVTTTAGTGQGGAKLVAKEDRASVNTFGRAETPISDLVDAAAGVTPKIIQVTSAEPKKNYVGFSIIDNGQKIAWTALCTATATEKTQSSTIKISAPGQPTVEAKETVLLGDNVANQGFVPPANCAPKP